MMTSISVVIPCYRYGRFLEDCVASVLDDQAGVDVRVLIIDDASPDDSAEVARKIAAREPRVELVVHASNKGNIATFNEGLLEWADGDYCTLVSADDLLTPGALRRARDMLDAHPDVGFVYGHALWFMNGDPVPAVRTRLRGCSVWTGSRWLDRLYAQAENPITSPEVVVRTSLQHRVGGYDPRMPHAADMEMWMRMAANASVGFLRGVDQAFYRLHRENMRKGFNALMDLRERRLVFESVLDRDGARLPGADQMAETMRRQLARQALWEAARAYDHDHTELDYVDEVVSFALDCWPGAERLPVCQSIRSGARLGPRSLAFTGDQKLRWWLRRRWWKIRGV
jgi:glycosyltransferase involved in cell wall biosynthesis